MSELRGDGRIKMEQEEERDKLESLVSHIARGPEKGSRETILAQHLAIATVSDPLTKIRYICEAARMLTPEERERYGVDEDWLEIAYRVAVSLLNASRVPVPELLTQYWTDKYQEVSIGWAFEETRENYERYIKPWICEPIPFWESLPFWRELEAKGTSDIEDLPFWKQTLLLSHHLTEHGYFGLVSQFTGWAMPEAMRLMNEITKSITPETYWEMIRLYKGEVVK